MKKIILFLTLLNFSLNKLSKSFWKKHKAEFLKKLNNDKSQYGLLKKILRSKSFEDYKWNGFAYQTETGFIFTGEEIQGIHRDPKMLDVTLSYFAGPKNCPISQTNYSGLKMDPNIRFLTVRNNFKSYELEGKQGCAYAIKPLKRLSELQFSEEENDLTKNTDTFVNGLRMLLENFGNLNEKLNFYHGNIEPNQIFCSKGIYTFYCYINHMESGFYKKVNHMKIYEPKYKGEYVPPEMRNLATQRDPYSGDLRILNGYELGNDYGEEAWALGTTLKIAIQINAAFLNQNHEGLKILLEVIQRMTERNPLYRLCSSKAFEKLNNWNKNRLKLIKRIHQ